jgi:hypothetical protein
MDIQSTDATCSDAGLSSLDGRHCCKNPERIPQAIAPTRFN